MNLKNCASKWALLAGASVVAALAVASSAQAACSTANGIVTCTGDNQPFTVTSDAQTIIAEGATVTGTGLSALRLNSAHANLVVNGTISATGATALTIQNGSPVLIYDPYAGTTPVGGYLSYPYLYPHGRVTVTVGAQGVISGDTGIWIERSSGRAAIIWATRRPQSTIAALLPQPRAARSVVPPAFPASAIHRSPTRKVGRSTASPRRSILSPMPAWSTGAAMRLSTLRPDMTVSSAAMVCHTSSIAGQSLPLPGPRSSASKTRCPLPTAA